MRAGPRRGGDSALGPPIRAPDRRPGRRRPHPLRSEPSRSPDSAGPRRCTARHRRGLRGAPVPLPPPPRAHLRAEAPQRSLLAAGPPEAAHRGRAERRVAVGLARLGWLPHRVAPPPVGSLLSGASAPATSSHATPPRGTDAWPCTATPPDLGPCERIRSPWYRREASMRPLAAGCRTSPPASGAPPRSGEQVGPEQRGGGPGGDSAPWSHRRR